MVQILDAFELSTGSNGKYIPYAPVNGTASNTPASVYCEPGTGGGCIVDGLWAEDGHTTTIGSSLLPANQHRHRLRIQHPLPSHDLSQSFVSPRLGAVNVSSLLSSPDMAAFQTELHNSVQTGDHFGIGGDMMDVFTSRDDSIFRFPRENLDRLESLRQDMDDQGRMYLVRGMRTWGEEVTLEDVLCFRKFWG